MSEQSTHWVGCWEHHLDCALAKIERMHQACNDYADKVEALEEAAAGQMYRGNELFAEVERLRGLIRLALREGGDELEWAVGTDVADQLRSALK